MVWQRCQYYRLPKAGYMAEGSSTLIKCCRGCEEKHSRGTVFSNSIDRRSSEIGPPARSNGWDAKVTYENGEKTVK